MGKSLPHNVYVLTDGNEFVAEEFPSKTLAMARARFIHTQYPDFSVEVTSEDDPGTVVKQYRPTCL